MMTGDPDRTWKAASGLSVLVALVLFIAFAIAGMLATGGSDLSDLPVAWLWSIFRFTAWQALLSTALSVALAIPVALSLARQQHFPGRGLLLQLMAIPLSLPVLVGAFAIVGIWGRRGIVNDTLTSLGLIDNPISIYGLSGILLAHVFFNLPLAGRLLKQSLDRIPPEHFKLSASLGMGRLDQFRLVEWPALAQVMPGLAALIFMLCATSFTLVLVLGGGPAATTLEVAIYQSLKIDYDPARAVFLSFLQIALSATAALAFARLARVSDASPATSAANAIRLDARSIRARLSDGLILILFAIFLVAPLAEIATAGLGADLVGLVQSPQVQSAIARSLALSATSGFLACLAILAMLEARAAIASRFAFLARLLVLAPGATLLVPVLALSTGWFVILNQLGLVETFRGAMVIVINMLMALPFTLRVLEPALTAHHARHDRLAANLGLSGINRLRLVDWPLLKRPLMAAFSFAMALSLGDLGVVAMFGSDDFITLPSLLHARLGSYRSTDAAGLALILTVLALALSWPAARLETNREERP